METQADVIVSLVPGGMVTAQLLAARLSLNMVYGLSIKTSEHGFQLQSEILEELTDSRVLLVEGFVKAGDDMEIAKAYLENKGAAVKTACLYILSDAPFKPDFFVQQLSSVIAMPWE